MKTITQKCQCGCGQIVNPGRKYIHGHNRKGKKFSDKQKAKLSLAMMGNTNTKGYKHSEETKRKVSLAHSGEKHPMFGKHHSEEAKKKLSLFNIGKELSEETKKKMSLAHMGRKFSEETKKKISVSRKGMTFSEEHKRNISIAKQKMTEKTKERISLTVSALWKNAEYQNKMQKARNISPNKAETNLGNLLNKLFPKEYKYVGDFQFWLGGKNPDFMNINGQKKLIELYGDYWHKDDDPQDRIDHFKQYGFNTLVIWEHELKDISTVKSKIKEFHKGLSPA